ncbi:hypothetical protein CTI12_AA576770 [Artemisia annua]|uniref:Uncharacterized protein n=1 Tax=Artemisia annua TaxID=35608 RepID=A0A2U1KQA7_ARTAN|nr:hypothetical protein CTI12_AA576770 [Artemisia annua]
MDGDDDDVKGKHVEQSTETPCDDVVVLVSESPQWSRHTKASICWNISHTNVEKRKQADDNIKVKKLKAKANIGLSTKRSKLAKSHMHPKKNSNAKPTKAELKA